MKKKINDTIYDVVEGVRVNENGVVQRILQGMYDNTICYNNIKAIEPDEPVNPDEPVKPGTLHTVISGGGESADVWGSLNEASDHWHAVDEINNGVNFRWVWRSRDMYYTAWNQHRYLEIGSLSYIDFKIQSAVLDTIPDDAEIKSMKVEIRVRNNEYNFDGQDAKITFICNGTYTDIWTGNGTAEPKYEGSVNVRNITKAALEDMRLRFSHVYDTRYSAGTPSSVDYMQVAKVRFTIDYMTYE